MRNRRRRPCNRRIMGVRDIRSISWNFSIQIRGIVQGIANVRVRRDKRRRRRLDLRLSGSLMITVVLSDLLRRRQLTYRRLQYRKPTCIRIEVRRCISSTNRFKPASPRRRSNRRLGSADRRNIMIMYYILVVGIVQRIEVLRGRKRKGP